ncbi:hypothetical protein BH20ACT19_BH20ACT19_00660 [soil metagenome]
MGSKKNAVWRVVVADQRSPRDGRIIESLGHYNPQTHPSTIVIDRERLQHWIDQGAQPTNTVRKLMRAPATTTEAVVTETAPEVATAPVATEAPAASDDAPAASNDEPTTPDEGEGAPAGAAGSDADAGPSGAAVEPAAEPETAPAEGEAAPGGAAPDA